MFWQSTGILWCGWEPLPVSVWPTEWCQPCFSSVWPTEWCQQSLFLFGTLKLVSLALELDQHGPRAKLPKHTLNVEFKDKGPFGTLKEPNTMHDQLYDYSSCSYSVNEQTEAQTCGADMRFISSSLVWRGPSDGRLFLSASSRKDVHCWIRLNSMNTSTI